MKYQLMRLLVLLAVSDICISNRRSRTVRGAISQSTLQQLRVFALSGKFGLRFFGNRHRPLRILLAD
jgi:hypothetical protein